MFLKVLTFIAEFVLFVLSLVIALKVPASRTICRRLVFLFVLLLIHSLSLLLLHFYHEAFPSMHFSHNCPIDLLFAMLLAPGIYLYLQMLLGHIRRKWYRNLFYAFLLLLPATVYFTVYAVLHFGVDKEIFNRHPDAVYIAVELLHVQFFIITVIYLLLAYKKMCILSKDNYLLEVEGWHYNLRWLFGLLLLGLIGCCTYFVWSHFHHFDHTRVSAGLIISFLLAAYLLVQWLYQGKLAVSKVNKPSETVSLLEPHEAESHIALLIETVHGSQLYLNTDCTLADVAKASKLSAHTLSRLLNEFLKIKFADFINYYRIHHTIAMLSTSTKTYFKLEELGRQCGFGSKSNFFRVFKRLTGHSPNAYLKENKPAISPEAEKPFEHLKAFIRRWEECNPSDASALHRTEVTALQYEPCPRH